VEEKAMVKTTTERATIKSRTSSRRGTRRDEYNPQPFIARLEQLLAERNETRREAALRAGLDHQTLRRYINGHRPDRQSLLVLADYFEVNPNEFLQLAGYPPMKIFEVKTKSAEALPPEAVDVAMDIARIADPGTRKAVVQAIRTLLKKYFE
jgi:transcriptional regulator with XRE-family HTH domain